MPEFFLAQKYATRSDLESIIRAEVGDNISQNRLAGHSIKGTRKQLSKLGLDDTTSIFGVRCVITDSPSRDRVEKK